MVFIDIVLNWFYLARIGYKLAACPLRLFILVFGTIF
jgi:hypothetical protein